MFEWALEWLWLGVQTFVALYWFFGMRRPVRPTAGVDPFVWIVLFALFSLSGLMGALYGGVFLWIPFGVADVPDFLRFLIFIPLVLFIGSAVGQEQLDGISKALKMVVIFNLITSFILISNAPVLADLVMLVYEGAKVRFDLPYIRIGIPFTNPNYAALVFLLIMSYFLFFRKSPIFSVLTMVSLFLTGSRSGLIAAVPVLILAYFGLMRQVFHGFRNVAVIICLHIFPAYYLSTIIEGAEGLARMVELAEALQNRDIGDVETAAIRFDLAENALRFIQKSPIFGVGPASAYGLDITDSQLVAWPLMYGIPCALLIMALFAFMFFNIPVRSRLGSAMMPALATGLSFFLMLATGDFMKNYRLFFISVLLIHCMGLATAMKNGSEGRLKLSA